MRDFSVFDILIPVLLNKLYTMVFFQSVDEYQHVSSNLKVCGWSSCNYLRVEVRPPSAWSIEFSGNSSDYLYSRF